MRFLSAILFFIPITLLGQSTAQKAVSTLGPNPLIIIDSVIVNHEQMQLIDPKDVTLVTIIKKDSASKFYGDTARDGAVIVETRPFARKHYISFFRKVSSKYDSLYSVAKTDSTFAYITNDKVATGSFEGSFEAINDKTFISMEIISADDLKKKYNISGKLYGVILIYKKTGTLK